MQQQTHPSSSFGPIVLGFGSSAAPDLSADLDDLVIYFSDGDPDNDAPNLLRISLDGTTTVGEQPLTSVDGSQDSWIARCDADGKNIRALSANVEMDNTPWVLPDGRVLYQRWEYVDRSQVHFHHLWTVNPDGTGQMTYYGNQNPGRLFIDAKPIPGKYKPGMDKGDKYFTPKGLQRGGVR